MSRRLPAVTGAAWGQLRDLTGARIALGRAGVSQPTDAHLAFQHDHALARDAVHAALDVPALAGDLRGVGLDSQQLHSAAPDRAGYLKRPDLGRRLDDLSRDRLTAWTAGAGDVAPDIVFVVADGLSARAVQRHAAPLLRELVAGLRPSGLSIAPAVIVEQGRVAVSDEVGERFGARLAIILLGERPGLSSPESLGAYLTFAPRVGRVDADRNCVSNIREGGLGYAEAAATLLFLATESLRRGLSGVQLKDETPPPTASDALKRGANFLTEG